MSDDRLKRLLEDWASPVPEVDDAGFQAQVWARLDGRQGATGGALGKALMLRAVPLALALLVGGIMGAGEFGRDEPDVLAIFDVDADWALFSLVGEGDHS